MRSAFLIACLCLIALAYKKDFFPVVPVPKEVNSSDQKSARCVKLGSDPLHITDAKRVCGDECRNIVFDAFARSISSAMESQRGLAPWKFSVHPEFDYPPVSSSFLPDAVTQVEVSFTGSMNSVPLMIANNTSFEYYEVTVNETGPVQIVAHTVWGVLHAFETLTQLFEWNGADFAVQRVPLSITDEPRFPWRGFLMDTARHFIPLPKLRNIVDGLASFKLNVLHLHIADAQSFPLEVPDFPNLAKSAFNPKAVFSTAEMKDFVEYARVRGVMVVPELDIPAHSASWRFADPSITADCFDYFATHGVINADNLVVLNPASDLTWKAINIILGHFSKTFNTSKYTHVGGDEVEDKCWKCAAHSSDILDFMKKHNLASYSDLEGYFDHYSQKATVASGKIPIVWEDVMNKDALEPGTIVHAWRSQDTLVSAVRNGHFAITSYPYYLDRQSPLCAGDNCSIYWAFAYTYREMYLTDPTEDIGLSADEKKRVLGGEAALWAEAIDVPNLDAMGFTRLGAFAERFWSLASVKDPRDFERRSQRHRCLNVKRGISPGSGSLFCDFCETRNFWN